ncbi:MAG: UvrD-helicase domain-containing protein, partial [Fervidobacterium sp.]
LIASELYESETVDNFEYDFKGVLEKTIAVLQNDNIRKHYQERFKYIIVDEFQDTNELQRTIFELIHTKDNYVFYVGDRKQSIYRFRGADVSVFVKTMNDFEKNQKATPERYKILSLQTNYRSHAKLVNYFNKISKDSIFNNVLYENYSVNESSKNNISNKENVIYTHEVFKLCYPELYEKLWFLKEDTSEANNKGIIGESIPKLDFIREKCNERIHYLHISAEGEKIDVEDEASLVALSIKNLVGKELTFFDKDSGQYITRQVDYKDIVILSYKLQNIEDVYREVFSKYGIPLYVVKGRGFYKRPEVRAILSALSVIQNPNNDYHFTEFFFTPFVELTNKSMSEPAKHSESSAAFDKFKIFHKIVMNAKSPDRKESITLFQSAKELVEKNMLPSYVAEMIRLLQKYDELKYFLKPAQILKGFVNESNYLTKISKFENSNQRLKNVKKLLDQAAEFNQQASTFLELTRMISKINDLQETEASELSEEDNVVKMMTIHASKGLEYNIVFLVNNDFSEKDDERVFFPSDNNGGRYIYIKKFLDKYNDELNKLGDDYKKLKKELEAELIYDETELLRKLYVAITRAKEMLFVVTYDKNSRVSKEKCAKDYLMHHEFEPVTITKKQLKELLNFENVGNEKIQQQLIDEEKIKKQVEDYSHLGYKSYISPTLLYNIVDEKSDKEFIDETSSDFEEQIFAFESEGYASYDKKNNEGSESYIRLHKLLEVSDEILEGKKIHRKLMSIERYVDLENLVERGEIPSNILKAKVLKELFENSKVFSEWRIVKSVEVDGKKYSLFGVPDKVFFKDGKIYVVDFKSSYLKEGTEEYKKYRFQLQFYMYLLLDFGDVGCGYLISTKTGYVLKIERPNGSFFGEISSLIKKFEVSLK